MEERSAVLLIDDEQPFLNVISKQLGSLFRVFTATSVDEGRRILAEHEIKVIVCDQIMPGEDGLSFLSKVKEQLPFVQRILLTGSSDKEHMLRGINQGEILRYILKPIRRHEIIGAVSEGVLRFDRAKQLFMDKRLKDEYWKELHSLPSYAKRLRKASHDIWSFLEISTGAVIAVSLLILLVGLAVIFMLYILKTGLGLDFIDGYTFF